jgi:hypothetical protein
LWLLLGLWLLRTLSLLCCLTPARLLLTDILLLLLLLLLDYEVLALRVHHDLLLRGQAVAVVVTVRNSLEKHLLLLLCLTTLWLLLRLLSLLRLLLLRLLMLWLLLLWLLLATRLLQWGKSYLC